MKDHENRLVELETRIAYQEHTLQQLNDVVTEQQARVARLESSLSALHERLREVSENVFRHEGGEEKPPHY